MSMFNPNRLDPPISLNRAVIADLPGVALDDAVRGQTGYQLLSAKTLADLIRTQAAVLQLDPGQGDDMLNRAFDACLISDTPLVRAAAKKIAQSMGRNLGYLLLTLRRGDAANRTARPEWSDSYWQVWAGIRQVILGGGLVSGHLGHIICEVVLEILREGGCDDLIVRLSPYRTALPVIGVARYAPQDCNMALAFDGGQTAIKRALAIFGRTGLREIHLLPSIPTEGDNPATIPENHITRAAWQLDRILTIIDQTRVEAMNAHHAPLHMPVLVSLALPMRNGHPLITQHGTYMLWTHLADNARDLLAGKLAERWGVRVPVVLEHDGTAAAAGHPGEPVPTAVLTLGTAIGIGFPSAVHAVWPIAPEFTLRTG